MQKVKELWKILALGVVAAAVGLMMASCAEDDQVTGTGTDTTATPTYKVTILSGTGFFDYAGILIRQTDQKPGAADAEGFGTYEQYDTVDIYAGTAPAGYYFRGWEVYPPTDLVFYYGLDEEEMSFEMPGKDISLQAVFVMNPPQNASIRFSWEAEQLPNIYIIAGSYTDVDAWYDEVYYAQGYDTLTDADLYLKVSHKPKNEGNYMVANNLYSNFNMGTEYDTTFKNVFFPTYGGTYTAVCSVIDPVMKDTFDIVANYTITPGTGSTLKYHEIGFDVGLLLDMEDTPGADNPDNWVVPTSPEDEDTAPLFKSKQKAAKFLKKAQKGGVTYYVFKRARK